MNNVEGWQMDKQHAETMQALGAHRADRRRGGAVAGDPIVK